MFDNIAKLRFEEGTGEEILAGAMISSEGEVMDFRQPVVAEGRVEDWMTNVLQEMRRTNRIITKEAIFKYGGELSRYCMSCPILLTRAHVLAPIHLFHTRIEAPFPHSPK